MERETNQPREPVRPPLGPHEPREPGQPADPHDHRRASGPHRRTQALGRWRRHEHPSITALVDWELVAFYESFEEPRP